MNNIEQKIDEIVNKVLSEELSRKIKNVKSQLNENKSQEIDEMEDFYNIAQKRRKEREMKKMGDKDYLKNMPDNDEIGVYSDNSDEDGLDKKDFRTPAGFKFGELVAGDMAEEETNEGNAFVLAADAARDAGKDEFEFPEGSGKMHKVTIKKDIKAESKKQTLQLTEDEMIELIERIVIQEKSSVESLEKKNSNETKKTNDDYVKSVTKKMKDYMKNMGVEYNPESDSYPRGNTMMDITGDNGKTKKSDVKKMYNASDSVEEYIDQIARSGGMENLEYDQIKPNEEWLEMNIEGSSKTGNSDEYANAVKTDVNKQVNTRRKRNILAKLKAMSYQKADQPVYDVAGETKHNDMMKALDLASTEEKKKDKINEELGKIKNLIGYNQKTQ